MRFLSKILLVLMIASKASAQVTPSATMPLQQLNDGNALIPSLSFQLDQSTGMYRPVAGEVGFSVAGVLRWDFTTARIRTTIPLVPGTTNSIDFGSTSAKWKTGWYGTSLVTPSVGPSLAQQHIVPSIASDTFALLAASQALLNKTINGLTPTTLSTGFTIAGGTISKLLTVNDNATVSGTNTGDQDLSGLALKTTTVNGHALSANVSVTASDVGLGNVENAAASVLYSGIGACVANSFAVTLNAAAAPTCSQPSASNLSNGVTGSGSVVLASSPTIVTPTIASFLNATHSHQNAAGGGALDVAAITTGIFATVRGGTGANNTATSGHYLKGDGTNFVTSTGSASGTGACGGGQVVSALNSDAAPTCTGVATTYAALTDLNGNAYDTAKGNGTFGHSQVRGTVSSSDPFLWSMTSNAAANFVGASWNFNFAGASIGSKYLNVNGADGDVYVLYKNHATIDSVVPSWNQGTAASGASASFGFSSPFTGTVYLVRSGADGSTRTMAAAGFVGADANTGNQNFAFGSSGSPFGRFISGYTVGWVPSSTTVGGQTNDIGIGRNAAGVLEVNTGAGSGTANQRDVRARHLLGGGTVPTVGTCGTSPSIAGNDDVGRATIGTSPSNVCTVTFGTAYTIAPVCMADNETTSGGSIQVTETTTTATFTQFALSTGVARNYTAADVVAYMCRGY